MVGAAPLLTKLGAADEDGEDSCPVTHDAYPAINANTIDLILLGRQCS